MAVWQTPKTDWDPNQQQGIMASDFNRIEGNIEWLRDQSTFRFFTIAGFVQVDNIPVFHNIDKPLQKLYIGVNSGEKLMLSNSAWHFTESYFNGYVHAISDTGEEVGFTLMGGNKDSRYNNTLLFDNQTGARVGVTVTFGAKNTDSVDHYLSLTDSWSLKLNIET